VQTRLGVGRDCRRSAVDGAAGELGVA